MSDPAKKFFVYDWAESCSKQLATIMGWKDVTANGLQVEGNMFEAAKKLYDGGLNVMLIHYNEKDSKKTEDVLFVDDGRFRQK